MSVKTNRAGQRIGPYLVLPDEGKRTRRGHMLWPVLDTGSGRVKYRRTCQVSRMARELGVPRPTAPPISREQALKVAGHSALLERRGYAQAAEDTPPVGQAGFWWDAVQREVPTSARLVARQLARLCGEDSQVTIPWRSLADAVGKADKAGRPRAYTERGAALLVETGWLRVATTGHGRAAKTTFYLMPGPA